MDMSLYRCLPLLIQTGKEDGRDKDELREDWNLVVGARCWLTVCPLVPRPSETYRACLLRSG